jgi:hypothetical protein
MSSFNNWTRFCIISYSFFVSSTNIISSSISFFNIFWISFSFFMWNIITRRSWRRISMWRIIFTFGLKIYIIRE